MRPVSKDMFSHSKTAGPWNFLPTKFSLPHGRLLLHSLPAGISQLQSGRFVAKLRLEMPIKAIIAICIGYGAGVWFSMLAVRKKVLLARAKDWLSARGRILESTLYKDPNRNATHFRVRYEFHVGE